MRSWIEILLRWRVPLLLLTLGATVLCALQAPHVRLSFSPRPLLVANEKAMERVTAFDREVPHPQFGQICLLEWPRVIDRPALDQLVTLSRRLEAADEVASVLSLASARVVDHGGPIPLLRSFPDTLGDGTVTEAVVLHPLLHRRLISADHRSVCLVVRPSLAAFDAGASVRDSDLTTPLLAWLEGWLPAQVPEGVTVRYIGGSVTQRAMRAHMRDDVLAILGTELIVFSLLLPLLFRSVRGVVLPIAAILVALAFCCGAVVALDVPINLLDLAIPGLILVIGLCDAVHLMHRFEEALASGRDVPGAMAEMMQRVGKACLFTSLTTAVGFASLLVAEHVAVREFGLKAVAAVAITFTAIVTAIPIGLAVWPVRRAAPVRVRALDGLRYGRPWLSLTLFSLVAALAIHGATRIVVDSRWLEELPDDDPVAVDLRWYESNFAGIMTIDVRIDGALDDPAVVAGVERLQTSFLAHEGVNAVESYTHWLREILGRHDPPPLAAAEVRGALSLLSLAGKDFPHHVINENLDVGRISFRTADIGSRRYFELLTILDELAATLPEGVEVRAAGFMRMAHEGSRLLVTTLLTSLLVSITTITLLISWLYGSLRLGLLSILPNTFPIVVALGVAGWFDIPLRIGIVMIFTVGVGLSVDDTIHLFTRFSQERRARPDASLRDALLRTIRTAGAAVVVTSAVLVCACFCYLPSTFRSLHDVGVLMSAIVGSALLADLFVLPLLVERFGSRRR